MPDRLVVPLELAAKQPRQAAAINAHGIARSILMVPPAFTRPWMATDRVRFVGEIVAAVLTDQRMPQMSGVEAARHIAQLPGTLSSSDEEERLPEVVFITAYDQYAVEAFEQGAVDYLLKPAQPERLALTVQRLRQRLASRGSCEEIFAAPLQQVLHHLSSRLNPSSRSAPLTTLQAQVGHAIQMIGVDEVLFFISDEKYTRVQTASREAFIRKPIKELVDQLDPAQFWQIHRSTLVHVQAIERVERDFRGRQVVHIKGHPQKLEVSRSYAGLFKGM